MSRTEYLKQAEIAHERGWRPTATFDSSGRTLWARADLEGLFPLRDLPGQVPARSAHPHLAAA